MVNHLDGYSNICISYLHEELKDVVDIASLCTALNAYLKLSRTGVNQSDKKNREKNAIIKSFKTQRKIYQANLELIPSPDFENYSVKIILSKSRQNIIHKQFMTEVLNSPVKNSFINNGSSYSREIHEVYAYSDENWSHKDASL